MARRRAQLTETTPQARLSSAIKTARDIMRKDAGLNGDLDRIPQLAWLLFLKAFDAREQQREVTERDYRPAIEEPFRWRDWAADPEGPTGPELVDFVNDRLLPYLRGLTGRDEHDPRDTLAAVFKETYNRMLSGYLLRDVVDNVQRVDFASSDDIHTMAHLYESMLREVRDAAGDSGEFYTPRPVIRFVVQQVAPQLGESVLDPACGTGGFLVEALEELRPQVESVEQWRALQADLRGIEKKPLPYLLGMMNLLLHGVEQPALVRDNALAYPVTQIRRRDRVDVIVTNPPFGGEEERVIQSNFPDATRTGETALLFLQLVQRRLKDGGRCGMVVPNGLLFGDGVAARIKKQLLEECNLHTVVRLPEGVFAPYTIIPSNLLFFEKTGRTREVWFYELTPPEGQKRYTKTKPMRFEEFAACQAWWGGPSREGRVENEHAWRVPVGEIETDGWNLDRRNPNRADDLTHRPPEELVAELIETEREIMALLEEIQAELRAAM
jgi:type I restriction enzyme M protein